MIQVVTVQSVAKGCKLSQKQYNINLSLLRKKLHEKAHIIKALAVNALS
jgi:hypothetical protein